MDNVNVTHKQVEVTDILVNKHGLDFKTVYSHLSEVDYDWYESDVDDIVDMVLAEFNIANEFITEITKETTMTTETNTAALMAEIAALKAENAALAKAKTLKGGLKVSEKGALSVYGMGRWPVTLYKSQWLQLLAKSDEIKSFIMTNDSLLVDKVEKTTTDK